MNTHSDVMFATHRARVPDNERVYVVGDIHGSIRSLATVMDRIKSDIADHRGDTATLVFLGDYIDRGLSSKEVIDFLLRDLPANRSIFLRGNHEEIALKFYHGDLNAGMMWLKYGGEATLMSYGVKAIRTHSENDLRDIRHAFRSTLPRSHLEFLLTTQYMHVLGDYCFVHAGIRPGVHLKKQSRDDLLWIRDGFLENVAMHDKIIVHGHTPQAEPDIKPNRIGIDTGAYETGRLTCLVLYENRYGFLHS